MTYAHLRLNGWHQLRWRPAEEAATGQLNATTFWMGRSAGLAAGCDLLTRGALPVGNRIADAAFTLPPLDLKMACNGTPDIRTRWIQPLSTAPMVFCAPKRPKPQMKPVTMAAKIDKTNWSCFTWKLHCSQQFFLFSTAASRIYIGEGGSSAA